jgi:hypothetical protein
MEFVIKEYLTKVIVLPIIAINICTFNSIGASAEWRKDSNGWWYAQGNSYYTGRQFINHKYYYFNSNGYMQTGWISIDGKWHYFDENGMEKWGWVSYGGKWYFLDSIEGIKTGWITGYSTDGNYYYLNNDGTLDESKTTKVMPDDIKKAYDIVKDYCNLGSNSKLVYYSIDNLDLPKEFESVNKNLYRFASLYGIGDNSDEGEEFFYDSNTGKLYIINQGEYTILDTKETFDSNQTKGNIVKKIMIYLNTNNRLGFTSNVQGAYVNIREEKDYYIINIYKNINGIIQSNGSYYFDKKTGEIEKK